VLIKPRAPGGCYRIAGLKNWAQTRTGPAPDEAGMAPALTRHQLDDRVRFAVAAASEDDSLVDPLHPKTMQEFGRSRKPQMPQKTASGRSTGGGSESGCLGADQVGRVYHDARVASP
jgi:hypothetical protein